LHPKENNAFAFPAMETRRYNLTFTIWMK